MNLYADIEEAIRQSVRNLIAANALPEGLALEGIVVEPPKDPAHGEMATNAAMVLAGRAKQSPRDIAIKLVAEIHKIPNVVSAEIAGPGFINIRFKPEFWLGVVSAILKNPEHYGKSAQGLGKRMLVEYVSANPTGPLHVGHARGAVLGDALASLLAKAGYEVVREYYINDAGAQIAKLASSLHLRYREAHGEEIGEIPEGLYPGDYLIPAAQKLKARDGDRWLGKPPANEYSEMHAFAVESMMELIREDLALLGIHHDVFTSEKNISDEGLVEEAIKELQAKDLVYTGVLEPPKGKQLEDWEPRPQLLFRSSQFGDDCDRPLKKSDGSYTYFAPDIAYHYDKVKRGFDSLIDVLGADHAGYVKRIKAAVEALSNGKVPLEVKLCQLVKFMRAGQPAKMSKRAGTFVTVRDLVEEVGPEVVRFWMLTRKPEAPLDFDVELALEQSKDNPVFYVQYAHARAKSAIRLAASELPEALSIETPLERLTAPEELALIRELAAYPRMIESAAASFEPHRVAFYLQNLAAAFHHLWNRGNEDVALRFVIRNDSALTSARLKLVEAVASVLASGLRLLGVEPVEEMR